MVKPSLNDLSEKCILGELRRFELITDDVTQLNKIIEEKCLTRKDIAIILFSLRVRPGFCQSDFGI